MFYPISIEWGDEVTATGIHILDIPGGVTAGDTFEQAYSAAVEIAHILLQEREANGLEAPKPSQISMIRNDPEFAGKGWGMLKI